MKKIVFSKRLIKQLVVVGCISAMYATPACALDLLETYRLAQTNDTNFIAARYALQAAEEKMPQALANLLPSVVLNGNRTHSKNSPDINGKTAYEEPSRGWNWNLQLTQPLFRAQNWQMMGQARAVLEHAQAQFDQAQQDLILRMAQAYFELDIAEETVHVAAAQVKSLGQQLELAKRGLDKGTNSSTEVYEAKSRLELAHAQHVSALAARTAKRAELEQIIGPLSTTAPIVNTELSVDEGKVVHDKTLRVKNNLPERDELNSLRANFSIPLPVPADLQAWLVMARAQAPAVRAQQAAVVAAKKELSKNKAAHLPTVDFTASYGRSYASNVNESLFRTNFEKHNRSQQVGLQMNFPLFSGGALTSRVREAVADYSKTQAELEAAMRQVETQVKQAYSGVINGVAQIEALTAAVEASEYAVKGSQVGYRLGTRINIDVLNAEQQLYTAQRDLIKARYDALLQSLKLKAAAGNLASEDIEGLNQWFVLAAGQAEKLN